MLDTLITSKTRIKLLIKFFLNPEIKGYLRGMEQEFGESTNAIRQELNRFEKAGLLNSSTLGNKKFFQANQKHPMFKDLMLLTQKYMGIDKVVDNLVSKAGDVEAVYLSGKLAKGIDSQVLELVIVGKAIDEAFVLSMAKKVGDIINKKITWVVYSPKKDNDFVSDLEHLLLIWKGMLI